MGPTGVGKTEIARRLAKLMDAPFVKVEATKFTEVGYVGRDVDSMIRDLVEASMRLSKQKRMDENSEMAEKIAERLGVTVLFVPTSWPTLTADVLAEPQLFDLAIGGITITDARRETMLMSEGYLANGKTILCRVSEAENYKSLADIDKPEVHVMVNPGGLNEKFANENLPHATIIVHQKNEEIPMLIAEGQADVMITEITEAPYYVQTDSRLAAPLLHEPFTHSEIGVLMRKGQDDLLQFVNEVIRQMKSDGSLHQLYEKYGFSE